LKRCTILLLTATVIFSLGICAPAMAARTDQTHLSGIVKTKQ